jgi:predicted AlkP superfamily phosphohydrolase/phosphomutase
MTQKLLVIGLDGTPPKLVFDLWKKDLPSLSYLADHGIWGPLRSCIPPITTPAWMCMMTGFDPGRLGLYGFRERVKNSYTKSHIASSSYIKEKTVWDILGEYGKKVIIVAVPPTFPPKKVNGILVSDFLTPSTEYDYTYPKSFKNEIKKIVGDYMLDVKFRVKDRKKLLADLFIMTKKRFALINYLIKNKPWDFFMFSEIGTDRIQHAFWKFMDSNHRLYTPNSPYQDAIFDYYKLVDQKIGELLKIIPKGTVIMVVSDHGAKKMDGVFCLNEWLIKEGYLALKKYPDKVSVLEDLSVDWRKTRAWAWGGYYARVFLNVKGRDPKGVIKKKDFLKERDILIRKLKGITDEKGQKLNNMVVAPEKLYPKINGNPSDIMAFFGDLSWRAAATVGHKTLWTFENDTGPDDAVHDWDGIFIMYDPKDPQSVYKKNMEIYDVAATILNIYGVKPTI